MTTRTRRFTPKLKAWRHRNGSVYSQEEIAALLGRDQSWLSKVETGQLEPTGPEWLEIARRLDVDLEEIVEVSPLGAS